MRRPRGSQVPVGAYEVPVQRPLLFPWPAWLRAPMLGLAVALLLQAGTAQAADRLTELATKLQTDKDFRVRTQAALALGVSQSERAVAPLCSGLDDENH